MTENENLEQLLGVSFLPIPHHEEPRTPILEQRICFRNKYHALTIKLNYLRNIEELIIDQRCTYFANASKKVHDTTNAHTILLFMTDNRGNQLQQCSMCRNYWKERGYFTSCPESVGNFVLVKTSSGKLWPNSNGELLLQLKMMCCSKHYENQTYLNIQIGSIVSSFPVNVIEWQNKSHKNINPWTVTM